MISGHEKFRFEHGNVANMRSEKLGNLIFWKVVRMRHAIVENDGMPRGILLQRSVFPNMPYRAKNRKLRNRRKHVEKKSTVVAYNGHSIPSLERIESQFTTVEPPRVAAVVARSALQSAAPSAARRVVSQV